MQKKISKLPFKGTPEQEAQLKAVIAEHCDDKSNVMVVMQKAQDIYGYLPIEVQEMIADGMGVPLEKVYGVATIDFLLDGGDGLTIAKNAKELIITDQLIIDVMLPYARSFAEAGKPIEYFTDGRVVVHRTKEEKR